MKSILCLISFCLIYVTSAGQTYVYHTDMLPQLTKNESYRAGAHVNYNRALSSIRDKKQATTTAMAKVTIVQQQVFDALTNVSGAVKNVKTIKYIGQYAASTLSNVGKALQIAASKPFLVQIASRQSIIIYERVAELSGFVSEFILNSDAAQLVKPTERDRLLYTVYRQLVILDAFTADLCNKLKRWKFQDAVYHIVPLNQYINHDRHIIEQLLQSWHH